MAELHVIRGPARGTSITLVPDRHVSIGSAPDATIRIGGDDIAAEHLVVKALKSGGFGVRAVAGPFLHNGRSVEAARLSEGDEIELGDTKIGYGKPSSQTQDQPEELGGFRVLGQLGKGGMGVVYRAEQVSLSREVALKVLSEKLTSDPVFVGRFQAEARAAARLHHPNVVQVFDVDHDGDTWFYSMELMHQGSVEQRLRREGKLPMDDAVQVIRDAASGLAFAESMRIVHRDIKPDNLMVDRHGNVKLADLGLALTDDETSGKVAGTPHFMSPEQAKRKPVDNRSDLYSLGCTFYRLVTGRTPFSGDTVKQILLGHVKQELTSANKVNSEVPAEISAIIDQLLEKDPDDRYQSADDLIADLDEVLTPPTRKGLLIGGIVAATVVAGGALVYALTRPEPKDPKTIEKVVTIKDTQAQEQAKRLAAENALLKVEASGAKDLELAEAYEAMAKSHPDTDAAKRATERAGQIRADVAKREAESERQTRAIESAKSALQTAFDKAIAAKDFPAAAGALLGKPSEPEIADSDELTALRNTLTERLETASQAHLDALRTAVETQIGDRNIDGARQALAAVQTIVAEGAGWPATLMPDRTPLLDFVTDAEARIGQAETALATEAEQAAWDTVRDQAFAANDGFVSAGRRLDLTVTRTGLAAIADAGEATPHRQAAALTASVAHAKTFLDAFAQVAGQASLQLQLPDGETGTVQAFAMKDGTGYVRIRPGDRRRDETDVGPEQVRRDLARWFPLVDGSDAADRAAFLAIVVWTDHLQQANRYLATLDQQDDGSGTSDAAYPRDGEDLIAAAAALGDVEWAAALRQELTATELMVRALRALSMRRNTTAAGLLDQLVREHGGTLAVGMLR